MRAIMRRGLTMAAVVGTAALGLASGASAQGLGLQKLLASDGATSDQFGISVSVSGDVAVVGAPLDDDSGTSSGSAYIYRFNGSSWVQEQKLIASDGAVNHQFGFSVSISGNVAVIGAHFDDDLGSVSGSAYVFRFNGSAWEEEQKLLASDGAAGDLFGRSVAISGAPGGEVAVVGAWSDDDNGGDSGSAYIYRFNGSSWVEEQKLIASDGAANDRFGFSVSISGDVAVVGAQLDDDNSTDSGSAYIYRFDGSMWMQEQKLIAFDGAFGDQFGISVSVSDDVAMVGAQFDDDLQVNSGSAFIYRFNGSTWLHEQKLLASDGAGLDQFGISVSVSGNVAVVGAAFDDDLGSSSGSAYIYRFNGSTWMQEQKRRAFDGAESDQYGTSVSVSGDVALIGAYGDGGISGSAYIMRYLRLSADCNGNGLPDVEDLLNGGAAD